MANTSESSDEPLPLHEELRRLRTASGKSIAQVGREIERSQLMIHEAEAGRRRPSLALVEALDELYGAEGRLVSLWHDTPDPRQQIVVTGGSNVIATGSDVTISQLSASESVVESRPLTLSEQRRKFHFDYLQRSLTQSTVMFWVSLGVMTLGAVIILASGAIVAFRDGGQGLKWVTGLSGTLITAVGGALYRQAKQKEDGVAKIAGEVAAKVESDDRFEKATALIERVEDPKLKDQLKTTAALTQLGLEPNADEVAGRLLPQENQRPEVTRGTDSDETDSGT
ncbi:helix-turn-helix domain-containing protein [Streptomyces broussonetiae]|uniref:Helix-turn-helix domain-containing protein n=1 Tax=Streptomyces broussonetiae TaxID=2686304 RepID=A0A6I6MXW9_9ACTN|nr:helix-turn-helix transcriptional regulator [Streptomyces broussonetiae]QHA05263.1 helix-turn-helix domain-containing protein [Streptomyces broussonetiae]